MKLSIARILLNLGLSLLAIFKIEVMLFGMFSTETSIQLVLLRQIVLANASLCLLLLPG
ncbi:MAG: hypothetical protein ACI909_000141 [Planctomycetota bacterium]|jgi:hypothetical protein